MSKIAGKLHSWVLQSIRERIADLQEIGFNSSQLYIESSYVTKANNTAQQYLCTEQGCEDFSRCLEPDARKVFLTEFQDRFERMRSVLEGKPVKKLPRLINMADAQEKEPLIRLYKNNAWGILMAGSEVYILHPGDIETLSRFITEMEKQNIGQIQCVVSAFLKSMKKSERLEEIASWGVKEKEPQQALLPDKAAQKPAKTEVDLNQVENLTVKQAEKRYSMSRAYILEEADKAGATIKHGRRYFISRKKMDSHFEKQAY